MSMIFINTIVLLILLFLLWCTVMHARDVKFAFLNLFRHKRRSFSTLSAIILGASPFSCMADLSITRSGS